MTLKQRYAAAALAAITALTLSAPFDTADARVHIVDGRIIA